MLHISTLINKDNIQEKENSIVKVETQNDIFIPVIKKEDIDVNLRIILKCMSPIKDYGVVIDDTKFKYLTSNDSNYIFQCPAEKLELTDGVYSLLVYIGKNIIKQIILVINY